MTNDTQNLNVELLLAPEERWFLLELLKKEKTNNNNKGNYPLTTSKSQGLI